MKFLHRLKSNFPFHLETQKIHNFNQNTPEHLNIRKKSKIAGSITISNFKLYYRAVIIKIT